MKRYIGAIVVATVLGALTVSSTSQAEDLQCKSDCYEQLRDCIAANPGGSAAAYDRHRARCEARAQSCLSRCD